MSMNFGNPATQHQGRLIWTGADVLPVDIRHHNNFGFTFEVVVPIGVDAVFNVEAAPASDNDVCVPGPFAPVEEVLTCVSDWGAVPGPQATITLPAGTPAGSICVAGLPCKPDAFLQLVPGSGDTANVRAVVTLSGPR